MAVRAAKSCLMPQVHFIVLSLIAFAPSDTARAARLTQLCWLAPSLVVHFGAIDTYVYTLAPCKVWEFRIEPQYRIQWICGIKDIKTEGTNHGRAGIGTVQYCGHGEGIVIPLP